MFAFRHTTTFAWVGLLAFIFGPVAADRGPVDFYDCTGKPDGNYIHPYDCTKFMTCVAQLYAYERDCVAGLNYDPTTDRCDWPEIAGCIIDPPSEITTTSEPTTTTPTTTTPTTTTPTTTTPTTTTPTTTTPTTTTPTTTTPTTTTPTTTTPTTTTPTTTQEPTSTPAPIFNCSGLPDGNYPNPLDCASFISCVAGEFEYVMDCPDGLHYNPSTDECDYPENAGCDPSYTTEPPTSTAIPTEDTTITTTETDDPSSTTETEEPTTTADPAPIFNCSGLPDGNYPNPLDCASFISCVAGEFEYVMDCPDGLHYNPSTDECDYPENAGCDPSYTTEPPTSTDTTTETDDPSSTTETEEPTTTEDPTSLSTTDTTTETTTEGDTGGPTYITTTETEDTTTEIGSSTTEDPTTENTTTITTTETTEPPVNSTTIDPDACDHDCEYVGIDCHNYYTCIDFQRKEYHECSEESGLAFNPILKVCDRIENVEGCRPETSDPPTTTESSCGCEYRAHETDCRRYYFCSDSCRRATCEQRECPGGLLWSVDVYQDGSLHQQCALPSNATCTSEGSGSAILEFSCYKKSDGIYINEHDCHSYWRCSNGQALLYACPPGFIYNPETKSCDFSARAQKFCSTE